MIDRSIIDKAAWVAINEFDNHEVNIMEEDNENGSYAIISGKVNGQPVQYYCAADGTITRTPAKEENE